MTERVNLKALPVELPVSNIYNFQALGVKPPGKLHNFQLTTWSRPLKQAAENWVV